MRSFVRSAAHFLVVAAVFGSSLVLAAQVIGTVEGSRLEAGTTYHVINEEPQGLINGWNTKFTLSQVPQAGSPVNLYRNGVRLIEAVDYQIQGGSITLSPDEVPRAGDALEVSYSGTAEDVRSLSRGPSPVAHDSDEISIAATREALSNEQRNLTVPQNADSSNRRFHLRNGPRQPNPIELEALQILSARLAENSPGVAEGVEGLGDAGAPSIYASHQADGRRIQSADPQRNLYVAPSASISQAPFSRGIEMLEERLGADDPHELGGIGSNLNPNEKHSGHMRDLHQWRPFHSNPSRASSSQAIDMLGRLGDLHGQLNIVAEPGSE